MFVYVIVNSETLKIYIGQHKGTNLRQYLQQKLSEARHRISARSILYASMRKHPKEVWSIHALVSDLQTRAECDAWERHYIKVLKTQHSDVGYNICRGGEGFTGSFTVESRQKMSVGHLKSWHDGSPKREEQRKNCSKAGKINGRKAKENCTGVHAMTREQRQEVGRWAGRISGRIAVESGQLESIRTKENCVKGGQASGRLAKDDGRLARMQALPQTKASQRRTAELARVNKTGIFAPENSGKGGRAALEQKAGWFGRTLEQHSEDSKKGGRTAGAKNKAQGIGFCGMSVDQRKVNGFRGAHLARHVNRNIVNPNCKLCMENSNG